MQVEGQQTISVVLATGARVSNAYTIYLLLEDSPEKFGLILHGITESHGFVIKVSAVEDEYASY